MASYTGLQSVLDAVLGDYCAKGFSLSDDPHFLYLSYAGESIAVFSATGVAIAGVLETCKQHLDKIEAS